MLKLPNIALCQLNLTVGAIQANADQIIAAAEQAKAKNAQIAVFPELALSSYSPEDLLLRDDFYQLINKELDRIVKTVSGIYLVLGYPARDQSGHCFDQAGVFYNGECLARYNKQELPNYSVFDEKRYFTMDHQPCVVEMGGTCFGILICEDLWHPEPIAAAKQAGAQAILSLNASPFSMHKAEKRVDILKQRIKETALPIVYVNLIGGQDELVFDGGSMVLDSNGNMVLQAPFFKEDLAVTGGNIAPPLQTHNSTDTQTIYNALTLGTRDYIRKNGFPGALIGLSGGIDSALTLAIAADALGPENVHAVMMPSQHTSQMSLDDAKAEADALGVKYSTVPIANILQEYTQNLNSITSNFQLPTSNVMNQNLQARIRGNLLMALSNYGGKLVLTTGNKSEMSVGYATLYGDMAGGFAVLKDVPKTLVYELAKYRNTISAVIPENVIIRPPSAELAPDQKDTDSLPPYDILDPIIERYVELDQSVEDIIAAGIDANTVKRVVKMIKRNEYKRRQAPPGIRITERAFGKDRRYPITSGNVSTWQGNNVKSQLVQVSATDTLSRQPAVTFFYLLYLCSPGYEVLSIWRYLVAIKVWPNLS